MPKIIDNAKVYGATVKILIQHGYENATTKAIAAAADIHEATLFRKYGSKFDLIDQAIRYHLSDTPLHNLRYTGELQIDLMSILQAYVEVSKTHGDIMLVLFVEVARDQTLQSFLHTPMQNLRPILDMIEKYQIKGLLKKEAPITTLYSLIGPIMIQNMTKRTNNDFLLPEIDLQQHLDAFLYGRSQESATG